MKIFDKMGNEHESVIAALEAEKEYDEKVAEEKARKERLATERAERAKEVENAFKDAATATGKYVEVLNGFLKDYGSYHQTIRDTNLNDWAVLSDLIDTIFAF